MTLNRTRSGCNRNRMFRALVATFVVGTCSCWHHPNGCVPRVGHKNQDTRPLLSKLDDSTSATGPVPPPPPLSMPVWSLAAPTGTGGSSVDGVSEDGKDRTVSSTRGSRGTTTSMNIVTFATGVSVAAPKRWIVSLFYDTKTKDAFCQAGWGVLQLLRPSQKGLVDILGKHSGYGDPNYNKKEECSRAGSEWVDASEWTNSDPDDGFELLSNCASYIHLRLVHKPAEDRKVAELDAGDHLVVLCEVLATGEWEHVRKCVTCTPTDTPPKAMDPISVLYTGQLREEGLL